MIKGFFYRLFFSFSFLLLFSLNHIDYASPAPLGEHPLIAGWKAAGFAGGEIEIEGWSIIAEQFTPLSVLQKKAKNLQRRLRLQVDLPPYSGEEPAFAFVNLNGCLPDGSRIILTLQSVRKADGTGETHCGLMGFAVPATDLRHYLRHLEQALAPLKENFPFKLAIRGEWPGRLSEDQAGELAGKIFARMKAEVRSGGPAGASGRWQAYSPYFRQEPGVGNDGVNMEFAYCYNPGENVTQLILGTPLIPFIF
ncbi:MAG: hypothetical protein GX036_04480 [Firmicutes bacterium]|jgi:hypothetical protein|nr:hypothetical protein [Bacillota bacterium]